MDESFYNRGYLKTDELGDVPGIPCKGRIPEKKCAVIECPQEIPCDPCQSVCPFHAISLSDARMTSLPCIRPEDCSGCGNCVTACPGMAIFVVDPCYADGLCEVQMSYEFLPVPQKGERITVCDRAGEPLCEGEITTVRRAERFDHTLLVGISCPLEYAMTARAFQRKGDAK